MSMYHPAMAVHAGMAAMASPPQAGVAVATSPAGPSPYDPMAPQIGSSLPAAQQGQKAAAALVQMRAQLQRAGVHAVVALARRMHMLNRGQSGRMGFDEFKAALEGVGLPEEYVHAVFRTLDPDCCAAVPLEGFLDALSGPMPPGRQAMVASAFQLLDRAGLGALEVRDCMHSCDLAAHPDLLAGRRTKTELLQEVLDSLGGADASASQPAGDGIVTAASFSRYYARVSACVERDDLFELLLRNTWHLDDRAASQAPSGPPAPTLLDGRADPAASPGTWPLGDPSMPSVVASPRPAAAPAFDGAYCTHPFASTATVGPPPAPAPDLSFGHVGSSLDCAADAGVFAPPSRSAASGSRKLDPAELPSAGLATGQASESSSKITCSSVVLG